MSPQTTYNARATAGRPGMRYDNTGRTLTVLNVDPQAKQIQTVKIDTATNDEKYSVVIDGVDIEVTGDGSATATEIKDDFVTAINSNAFVSGKVVAESSTSDTFTITARHGGVGFTFALGTNAAKMTNTDTQANATADPVPFGALVVSDGWVTDTLSDQPQSGLERKGKLADADNFTAQVDELKLTYDAGVDAIIEIEYYDPTVGDWVTRVFEHTQATDADTSIVALAGLINGQMPANTVVATHPTNDTLTLTAEVAGTPFRVSYGFGTGEDTGVWEHTTNASALTDVTRAALGIAEITSRLQRSSPSTPGELDTGLTEYPENFPMAIREDGRVWVEPEEAPSNGDAVFVRLVTSGSLTDKGLFTPTAGAGVVRLPQASWHLVDGDLAVIDLRN